MNFVLSKPQQNAVRFLIVVIAIVQGLFYFDIVNQVPIVKTTQQIEWEAHQIELDRINRYNDSIACKPRKFNPNYISDYKGYVLGLSLESIDRLHQFRLQNKFVNSSQEFQKVTGVSDSLLRVISPYFKFPDWIVNKTPKFKKKKTVSIDINKATLVDLQKVSGIGKVLSKRIFNEREKLGSFVDLKQLGWVYGISDDVVQELPRYFIINKSTISLNKLQVNRSSLKELKEFPYFDYKLSKEIIVYRTMHGNDIGIEDLYQIKGLPKEKVAIIALYLHF